MTFLDSFLLGIVEGATEFLPISSTGHLILASSLLGVAQTDFAKTFEIAIQLGAILAVIVLYGRALFDRSTLLRLAIAFVPTGIIGLALYQVVKTYLLGNEAVVLASLLAGGLILIAFERWHGKKEDAAVAAPLSYRQAFIVGLCQSIALIPGISRSGATIIGGLALGIERATIVEFSFLLAVPTMLAATGLSLMKTAAPVTPHEWGLLSLGFAAAFVVALASIRWLLSFVRRHSFTSFGFYRIFIALLFYWFFFR